VREELKRRGGYVTADVIDVSLETLNLEVMLAKFNREHGHDEVRFIIRGRGLCHPHSLHFPLLRYDHRE
jgi:1,2-dihydroxy-3-keto-5-methylthiopentene dioxygenase